MKVINYILLALLLLALGTIAWFYFNPKIEKVYVQIKPKPEIIYIEKSDGGQIATITEQVADNPAETISDNYLRYVNDTLLPALNDGLRYKTEVKQLTKINAVLSDSLSRKNVVINEIKKDAITWKTKYIEVSANPIDSSLIYAYNAQLDFLNYERRKNFFSGKESLIAVSSPDKNMRINGMENFTKSIKAPKNVLELNLNFQGVYYNDKIYPQANGELILNPDGRLRPFVGYGYFYDYSNGKLKPIIVGGAKFNLLKF